MSCLFINSARKAVFSIRKCSTKSYDLAVIGSGPGGYVAAIKSAQLGMNTICIERCDTLGGTCLNVGCIPSKALLHCSHQYHEISSGKAKQFGIDYSDVKLNLSKMMKHKETTVKALTGGVAALFKHNKVHHLQGTASFNAEGKINVIKQDNKSEVINAKNVIIATGSETIPFPGITVDEESIVSSTGALSFKTPPNHLIVIGGGVIGLELGSVWRRLGSQVTCVEFLDNVGGNSIDGEVSRALLNLLKKDGINFLLGHKVLSSSRVNGEIIVKISNNSDKKTSDLRCDALLICVGRRPCTNNLNLDKIGVKLDNKGRIIVNDRFETSVKSVFAIGDCIPGPMLAHKAEDEGILCVEGIHNGGTSHLNYDAIPNVIYTYPEVAWVGMSEEDAKKRGLKYKIGKFPLSSNGRAKATGESAGFAKILAEEGTDRLLGAHFISSCAGEIINEMAMAIEYGASAEDVARVCHAHPTISEAMREACLAGYFGKPINSI